MDKRSWPWRKKSAASVDSGESSPLHPSRYPEDQSITSMSQKQQEDKLKHLNDRLLLADDLVKQHVKVAEEAVSGWEKSKEEYVILKQQMEAFIEQNHVAEDRVSELEDALKECTWQLRQAREDQEQRIHEAIVRKTKDWDNLRSELEVRLTDANQQLVEAGEQNTLLFKTVQEQAQTITELGLSRSQAEADVEMLQLRIEALEKENASVKYEIIVLSKEVEIRNHEREMNKRSAEVANKQHLENIKRIAKLEAECQRLRVLVRKKLPGPGALAQMKLEVEGLDSDKAEITRWRFAGKVPGSPRTGLMESPHKMDAVLSERLFSMEEETKMLKEALAKRNVELQAARLMYTRTADKLSMYEAAMSHSQRSPRLSLLGRINHIEASSVSLSVSKEPSQASMSEDGNDDEQSVADSWASAMITELAQFPKDKVSQNQANSKALERLDSLEDFLEMERLVSFSPRKQETRSMELDTCSNVDLKDLSNQLRKKEAELEAANKLCQEVSAKLSDVEEQLNVLLSKNAAIELDTYTLQQKLTTILAQEEKPERVLENVRNEVKAACCSTVNRVQNHVMKHSKDSFPSPVDRCMSAGSSLNEESLSLWDDSVSKLCNIGPELATTICKLIHDMNELALGIASQNLGTASNKVVQACLGIENCTQNGNADGFLTCIKSFISTSDGFLHGKVQLLQFMVELSSVLNHLKERQHVLKTNCKSATGVNDDSEVASNFNRNVVSTNEQAVRNEMEEELRKLRSEKAALESHMRSEFGRIVGLEESVARVKQEKFCLEMNLEEEREKLETLQNQLQGVEQQVDTLRVRLASAEFSKNMADEHITAMAAAKAKLETQLETYETERKEMAEKLEAAEVAFTQEQAKNAELTASYEAIQQQLTEDGAICLRCRGSLDAEKSLKDQEIADAAAKLAECQHNILILGRQLNSLVVTNNPAFSVSDSSMDQASVVNGVQLEDCGTTQFRPFEGIASSMKEESSLSNENADAGENMVVDVTDDELISAAKGVRTGTKMSDLFGDDHEGYIQAVVQMPISPDSELDKRLVKYVPKPVLKKKGGRSFVGIDLSKSLNLTPLSSPQKHGSTFSRFFSRNKNA